jgi:hypothetical protein
MGKVKGSGETLAERVDRGRQLTKVEAQQERPSRKDLLGRIADLIEELDRPDTMGQ